MTIRPGDYMWKEDGFRVMFCVGSALLDEGGMVSIGGATSLLMLFRLTGITFDTRSDL